MFTPGWLGAEGFTAAPGGREEENLALGGPSGRLASAASRSRPSAFTLCLTRAHFTSRGVAPSTHIKPHVAPNHFYEKR